MKRHVTGWPIVCLDWRIFLTWYPSQQTFLNTLRGQNLPQESTPFRAHSPAYGLGNRPMTFRVYSRVGR
jgi:hypothetical protein